MQPHLEAVEADTTYVADSQPTAAEVLFCWMALEHLDLKREIRCNTTTKPVWLYLIQWTATNQGIPAEGTTAYYSIFNPPSAQLAPPPTRARTQSTRASYDASNWLYRSMDFLRRMFSDS